MKMIAVNRCTMNLKNHTIFFGGYTKAEVKRESQHVNGESLRKVNIVLKKSTNGDV